MLSWMLVSARSPPARARPAACWAKRAASAYAPVVTAMFARAAQMVSSTRHSGLAWRALASAARRRRFSAPLTSARLEPNSALTARARVARVFGRAGQRQRRLAVQQQGIACGDLAGREAGQYGKRGVDVAGGDRP